MDIFRASVFYSQVPKFQLLCAMQCCKKTLKVHQHVFDFAPSKCYWPNQSELMNECMMRTLNLNVKHNGSDVDHDEGEVIVRVKQSQT